MANVSTYLNFPDKTEEAFNFYKSVFKTEFGVNGIQRYGDMPGNHLTEEQKKLVLYVELPIKSGHILRGSDAPESMGFKISVGNNMHINIETDTREETKRLFDALSKDGTVICPLGDMFWGAYFGQCTDKFGVN